MGLDTGIDAGVQLLVPALQAAATLTILEKQKDLYDDLADDRIELIDEAVEKYVASVLSFTGGGLARDAFGTVPDAAEFVPIDNQEELYANINDNLQNLPAAERLIVAANRMNENNDIARLLRFSPDALHQAQQNSTTILRLMHGHLEVDTLVDLTTDQAENAAFTGRTGNTRRSTARALGLRRMDMVRLGRQEMSRQADWSEKVSSTRRQLSIQDFVSTPSQKIGLQLSLAQLIQQSLQNKNNADAAGDPTKFAEFQGKMQMATAVLGQEAQRGNMINQFVPNYAAILQPAIESISESLLGSASRTGFDGGGNKGGGVGQSNGKSNGFKEQSNLD